MADKKKHILIFLMPTMAVIISSCDEWSAAAVDGGGLNGAEESLFATEMQRTEWTTFAGDTSKYSDVNGDGNIDYLDISENSDVNGDGYVNLSDLNDMKSVYNHRADEIVTVKDADGNPVTSHDNQGGTLTYNEVCLLRTDLPATADHKLCDPTMSNTDSTYTLGGTGYNLDIDQGLNRDCLSKCIVGTFNGRTGGAAAFAIRMFYDADVNKDGRVNINDLAAMKPFYRKGFGPSFNNGFERVDYDGNGYVSPNDLIKTNQTYLKFRTCKKAGHPLMIIVGKQHQGGMIDGKLHEHYGIGTAFCLPMFRQTGDKWISFDAVPA